MSIRNTNGERRSERLTCSFYSSADARSFGLTDPRGLSACLVCVGDGAGTDALSWLQSFLGERFKSAFAETVESRGNGSLVAFFQSAHADLFRERARRPEGLAQISLVAAHVSEDAIEIASVGSCAVYRIAPSGVERVIPSEGNGAEISYMGASLKVSVEMVRRSLARGVSYLLTSKRVDVTSGWSSNVDEAVRAAGTDPASAAHVLFGAEGGAFATIETNETKAGSDEERAEAQTLGTDVSWYRKLREELAGAFRGQSVPVGAGDGPGTTGPVAGGTPGDTQEFISAVKAPKPRKGFGSVAFKRASLVALAVVVSVAIYASWAKEGGQWAMRLLGRGGVAGDKIAAGKTLGSAVSLSSMPPGAEVVLDDSMITSRTPVSLVVVPPGTHRIAMRLGELGEWSGSVAVQAGDTAEVRVAFVGEIAVNSKPQEGLSVILDGEPRGYTPCVIESVPAGLHVVRVEGRGFSAWEEEVLVTHAAVAEVQVSPGKLPETGAVRVTAGRVSEEGYKESNGRAVFIDGRRAGVTPLKIDVKPGFHSIRVVGTEGDAPSVSVIQVRPGGKHFIRAEFAGVPPILVGCLQTRVPSGGQAVVHASLSGNPDANVSKVELYLEKTGSSRAGWEPMTLLPGSHSIYAAAVPAGLASGDGQIRYFVRVTTSEGLEYFSDLSALTAR